ncbi:MAG: alpha-amylase family glycosyl hydrolase [Schaedlerella sp.]|nr:alpha-amylase family glycosyl hydrolase [Schaedlerella sp.]
MGYKILEIDPSLKNFENDINLRMDSYKRKRKELLKNVKTLKDFANAYEYFGFHKTDKGWVYREWAPAAEEMYLTGDFVDWDKTACPMTKLENGVFEVVLEGEKTLEIGQKVKAIVVHDGKQLERIPTYATRVVQDKETLVWSAEIEDTFEQYEWTDQDFKPAKTPFIYECHIGMAQDKYDVGTYKEFKELTLPRIKELGYNTIQIMAIMEHPYYGSFGYQVSNFYAAASRYGKSEDLKDLINTAHSMGITVLLDVVHSHAVKNTAEGLNEFDGTVYQFFHEGAKGDHSAWGTKLFNYGKNEVIHFLLSNLKYWMEIFHFDGFRFDGVTSMLYLDHGLGTSFDCNEKYFSMNTDIEAITYLQLANELIHQVNKKAITIAEDMSALPGMCLPIRDGGVGFNYRLSMGMPDLWIKMLKESKDEDWNLGKLWYELTIRRPKEKNIGYAESHDQALVGDKTLMFRLCDAEMYFGMEKKKENMIVDRGIALHKMIRLVTSSVSGEGYLNFMGNEFGHPEWIDFPREGNGWSYHYCRRQWSLVDNKDLRYEYLNEFDKSMLTLLKKDNILAKAPDFLLIHEADNVLAYAKGNDIFVFNFHPNKSYEGYFIPLHEEAEYQLVLSTDEEQFGGQGRVDKLYKYQPEMVENRGLGFKTYLPARTAMVFKKCRKKCVRKAK